jgi:hypothetical protein
MVIKKMAATTKRKKTRSRNLTAFELETIINFNQGSNIADVFTYEKTWQRRLEQGLGLKPTLINDSGGRGYQLPKNLIVMPRAKRKYSDATKKIMAERLAKIRRRQPALL